MWCGTSWIGAGVPTTRESGNLRILRQTPVRVLYRGDMSRPKLTYFDFSGSRGEECRLALRLAGVDFEDDRVKGSDWPERKPSTPFGAMPILTIPGQGELAHSNAILVLIGRKHGLHPTDPWEAARHEQFLCAAEELRGKVSPMMRVEGEEARKKAREDMASGLLKTWGANVDALIGEGPFVGGAKPSVADIKLYMIVRWFASGVVDHVPTDVFAEFSSLTRLHDAVRDLPELREWTQAGS